jgi:hypothetical protein
MSRAVARGRARKEARPVSYLGVDEKAFRKGHRYHNNEGFVMSVLVRNRERRHRANSGVILDAEGWPSCRWRWS